MTTERRELYSSANGDKWFLCLEPSGRVFVGHEPNAPSGGNASEIGVGQFLGRGAVGPEQLALLDLIGTLVRVHEAERSVRTA
jgi:hypothetical protein